MLRSIHYLSAVLVMLVLSGCAMAPGSHISSDLEESSIRDQVDMAAITPELVMQLQRQRPSARPMPPSLRDAINTYEYRVGPGDILSIIVYDHPELTIPAGSERAATEAGNRVRNDGTIYYPFLGRVEVAGMISDEIRVMLTRGLTHYLKDPQVDVLVAAFNSQKVYLSGAFSSPGTQPITSVPLTIMDAISQAGGPSGDAFWHEMTLFRDGQQFALSLYDLLRNGDQTQNRLLRDGDTLHIPTAIDQGIAMMGQVRSPGNLSMGGDRLSLTDALSRAGGINEVSADASGVFVIRRHPATSDKLATVYQLNIEDAMAFTLGSRFELEPQDIVYVTTAPVSRWNRVISQLLPSITFPGTVGSSGRNLEGLL